MHAPASIYGCLFFALSIAGAQAADLGEAGPVSPPYGTGLDTPRSFVVVPACEERSGAILLRCLPRRDMFAPDDVGLIQIERSVGRPAPLPYKQLFTWP